MMLHAASRTAKAHMLQRLNETLQRSDGAEASHRLADELYAAAAVLEQQPRLRRTLGDPATHADARADLVRRLFGGRLAEPTVDVIAEAAAQRWSSPWDLADSLEILADDALLSVAERQGVLDEVEDELFRFERILGGAGELVAALDEQGVSTERRQGLLRSVLSGKTNRITEELLNHAVASGRKRSLLLAIDDLLEASAARRERSVARVISATELTPEQSRRLAASLTEMYGRPISVRSAVDRSVRGGLQVRIGDEVIDGTVSTRLAAARAALAG